MKYFGYVRVSTKEQNEQRQLIALSAYPIPKKNLYIDKQSGKDFQRPNYQKLIETMKMGDMLLIKSIDRLGRDYAEIMEQWRYITKIIGADIRVLDMPLLDTTYAKDLLGTFVADLVLQILSFTAQIERENILVRQAEGIEAAKARGISFGRPQKPLPKEFDLWMEEWANGRITGADMARRCNMSRSQLYRRLKQLESCEI